MAASPCRQHPSRRRLRRLLRMRSENVSQSYDARRRGRNEMTQTDKMLSRKEGRVGYVIFNNPERHNAVSLEMWEATARILEDFGKDDEIRVVVLTGAGD